LVYSVKHIVYLGNVVFRVPTFYSLKIPGLSRTVETFFQDLLGVHQHLNIKTNSSDLLYIQSVIQFTNVLKFIVLYLI